MAVAAAVGGRAAAPPAGRIAHRRSPTTQSTSCWSTSGGRLAAGAMARVVSRSAAASRPQQHIALYAWSGMVTRTTGTVTRTRPHAKPSKPACRPGCVENTRGRSIKAARISWTVRRCCCRLLPPSLPPPLPLPAMMSCRSHWLAHMGLAPSPSPPRHQVT